MGLPKQVRNQIKQGQEIEDQLRKSIEEGGTVDKSQQEIDNLLAEVSVGDPPKAEVTELHPKPKVSAPEVAPESAAQAERTDWKQKYSVLKGKYDSEVPRLYQDVREANTRIGKLEDLLAGAAKPAEKVNSIKVDFTPDEIADYGEDLLDVIGRKARSIVESEYRPMISGLQNEVSHLKTQLGETGQKVAKQEQNEVFAQLDATVKDWRKINVDPDFHEWLDRADPLSGEVRKGLLLKAFNRKNAHQVRLFFDKYVQENAIGTQGPTVLTPSGQGGTAHRTTLDLNDYIAPGSPKSGGDSGAPKDKRIWSSVEIGGFYSDVQKGRYKSRPADKIKIEADIISATREGRIR